MGRAALRGDASSPARISLLISKPTTKKNSTIRPSFIQWRRDFCRIHPPTSTVISVCQRLS